MTKSEYTFLEKGMMSVSDSQVIDLLVSDVETTQKLSGISISELARLSYRELRQIGVSHQRAIRMVAAFELNRRKTYTDPVAIHSSTDTYQLMLDKVSDLVHEEFWTIYLNRSNKLIKMIQNSKGGISGTVTDIRLILKEAIIHSASSIICCHNHPSGNLSPSVADKDITLKIRDAAKLMDLRLLDHVIIAADNYFSFADEGLI